MHGIESFAVTVEVDTNPQGLPGWQIVGLPEAIVRESKDRVGLALRNSGFSLRRQKITVNLAPANHKKSGNYFDLPIALGLLVSSKRLDLSQSPPLLVAGELLLSGDLHPVPGAIALAMRARQQNQIMVLPRGNVEEIQLVDGLRYHAVPDLKSAVDVLASNAPPSVTIPPNSTGGIADYDLKDVRGHAIARRALEIAAAGNHHIIMIGPPGVGKSMLARRLPGIMPVMEPAEALESLQLHSIAGEQVNRNRLLRRPFRAPHHGASGAGLVGGGKKLRLGEVSLAHHGVLFLDEMAEFHREALEQLRQPLESGRITIDRVEHRVTLPARFLLVAASNPCRCGYYGHPKLECTCTMSQIMAYRAKLSGPLLDRIDLHVRVEPVPSALLGKASGGETSAIVRARVLGARERQYKRYDSRLINNGSLSPAQTRSHCNPTSQAMKLLLHTIEQQGMSARAFDRVLRISRTIADLEGAETIQLPHLAEALQYRSLDKPL